MRLHSGGACRTKAGVMLLTLSAMLLTLLRTGDTADDSSRLLLISFDGFRHDYLDKTDTPNFDRFVGEGVRAKWVQDAFISKTFPNHFTIATGLYEESHGIVSNGFFDPNLNETFDMTSTDPKFWSAGAEPIWVTNQLQCSDCRSIVHFWPGSQTPIKGVLPSDFVHYDKNITLKRRIDDVVRLLSGDAKANLAMLYYHEPDTTAHYCGPESENVTRVVRFLDEWMGYLGKELKRTGLDDSVNVVVTSDHGFTSLKPGVPVIVLERLLPRGAFFATGWSPVLGVWPKDRDNATAVKDIYSLLKGVANMSVYLREDVPAHFHYSHNVRIAPVVAVADLGFGLFAYENDSLEYRATRRGEHGYDNREMDMHPFFVARGPSFRSGFRAEPFNNVDIYPLMCRLLGLRPAPNNGSLDNVCPMLLSVCDNSLANFGLWVFAVLGLGVSALLAILFIVSTVRRRRVFRPAYIPTPLSPRTTSDLQLRSTTDLGWDESDADELFIRGEAPRVSNWRKWSANWKRKWQAWRHSRQFTEESDSLLSAAPDVSWSAKSQPDELQGLPSHLIDILK